MFVDPGPAELVILDRDLRWETKRGSGAGGQNRNKLETAVVVTHLPSGVKACCESERSQYKNRVSALTTLRARLWAAELERRNNSLSSDRRKQVGSGMRGDKRRTIRVRDGKVNDHVTGESWSYTDYVKGNW